MDGSIRQRRIAKKAAADSAAWRARAGVQVRAVRFETGNLGDHKSVGGGFRKPG
jgi:putative component of toxin-antitoxin plasmid stabilization module